MPFRSPTQVLCESLTQATSGSSGAVILSFLEGVMPAGIGFTRASSATDHANTGLIETLAQNAPRFDVFPTTLQPRGLLLESPRTNLILNSADVAAAFPTNTNTTVTANTSTAPDGTSSADQVARSTTGAFRQFNSAGTLGQAETFSQFVKADGSGGLWGMRIQGTSPARVDAVFNLSSGTVAHNSATTWTNAAAGIIPLANGWYRCWVSATSSGSARGSYICGPTTNTTNVWENNGTAAGALVWGSQGEANTPFPSSYIPTSGSAATRAADGAVLTDLAALGFNPLEGTLLAEFEYPFVTGGGMERMLARFDSSNNDNQLSLRLRAANSALRVNVTNATVGGITDTATTYANGTLGKAALAWVAGSASAVGCLNGSAVTAANTRVVPSGVLNRLLLTPANEEPFGWLRRLTYWPTRLPDAQLQALTL